MTPGESRTDAQVKLDEIVKERVLRGISVLEQYFGPQWVDKVERRSLIRPFDITSATRCVLGLVFGDYDEGRQTLSLSNEDAIDCGFYTDSGDEAMMLVPEDDRHGWREYQAIYDALQDVWCTEFRNRSMKVVGCKDVVSDDDDA